MIALGAGVLSTDLITVGHPHLARINNRYFVIRPFAARDNGETDLRYDEAFYVDPDEKLPQPVSRLHEFAPIY